MQQRENLNVQKDAKVEMTQREGNDPQENMNNSNSINNILPVYEATSSIDKNFLTSF